MKCGRQLVLGKLHWTGCGGDHHDSKRTPLNVTVVCVYAPTAPPPPRVRSKFRYDLQDTIDAVPGDDLLVLLGDFKARVGGLDQLTVMNTWFRKKSIHYGTWTDTSCY